MVAKAGGRAMHTFMLVFVLLGLALVVLTLVIWRYVDALRKEEALRHQRCPTCRGSGRKEVSPESAIPSAEACPSCQGTGVRRAA
jgi:hypothetical protein